MSLNFDRKKKVGSKPELPVLDSIPPSKIGAIYLSDASSPLSSYSEQTKGESKRNELIPVSGEIHVLDVMVEAFFSPFLVKPHIFFSQKFCLYYGLMQANQTSI